MATGALTRRAARADTQQAPIAPAIQLLPAFCLWGGFCVCENTLGGIYGASERHRYRRRLPAARKPRFDAAVCGGGKERRIGEYKARHMRTEPVGESAYVALCIHPVGAELGGVRATDDTARENQWAHTEAGEEPPSGAYESDAVRRLDTTPPPPAGSADGRSRRGGQTGGVNLSRAWVAR